MTAVPRRSDAPLRLREPDVHWRPMDGEIVILDSRGSLYLAASKAGANLWPLLAAGTTASALTDRLCTEFGIDRERARRDVDAFISELDGHGLLEA
jgi:hypothetical protein